MLAYWVIDPSTTLVLSPLEVSTLWISLMHLCGVISHVPLSSVLPVYWALGLEALLDSGSLIS